jgi:hypothetical protein
MLICDDLRQEVGNKLSTMGIYAGVVGFPAGEGAFGLAKLASVFVIGGLTGVEELKYRHFFAGDPALPGVSPLSHLQPLLEMRRPDPTLDEHIFGIFLTPAVFQGSGLLAAHLDLELAGETFQFRYEIRVVRGAPGAAPLAVVGSQPN